MVLTAPLFTLSLQLSLLFKHFRLDVYPRGVLYTRRDGGFAFADQTKGPMTTSIGYEPPSVFGGFPV